MNTAWKYMVIFAALSLLLVLPPPTNATPVEVAYTIAGSAGNWTLDFSFTNNMHYASCPSCAPPIIQDAPGDEQLYRVGVSLPARDIVGSPFGYNPDLRLSENLSAFSGASGTVYNNVWQYEVWGLTGALTPQTTVDGFLVHVSTEAAPLQTSWFALGESQSVHGKYIGGGCIGCPAPPDGTSGGRGLRFGTTTPGFEGFAQGTLLVSQDTQSSPVAPVPEPSTWLLLASGLLVAWRVTGGNRPVRP